MPPKPHTPIKVGDRVEWHLDPGWVRTGTVMGTPRDTDQLVPVRTDDADSTAYVHRSYLQPVTPPDVLGNACGSELAESAPLAEEWRAFHEAATGVDPGPETPAPLAEPVRERDVVDFLLARHEASPLARCTGISSDALAYYAAGGRAEPAFPNEYPHDGTDLAACEKTYQMAPVQLRERMLPILERFRAHVASPGTGTEAGE